MFVVEGVRLCSDALDSNMIIDEFYYTNVAMQKNGYVVERLRMAAMESFEVNELVFDKISDTVSPQGVLCVIKERDLSLTVITDGRYLALEDISDPSNLGAIARTAEALGVDGLILTQGCCDIYNGKAQRASMGALFRLPILIVDKMSEFLKMQKLISYAAVPDRKAVPIAECSFENGGIIVIGNEANGLSDETILACSKKVTIPMKGKAESLNASAAATILLYEITRDNTK